MKPSVVSEGEGHKGAKVIPVLSSSSLGGRRHVQLCPLGILSKSTRPMGRRLFALAFMNQNMFSYAPTMFPNTF